MWSTKITCRKTRPIEDMVHERVLLPRPKRVSRLTNTDTLVSYKYKMLFTLSLC